MRRKGWVGAIACRLDLGMDSPHGRPEPEEQHHEAQNPHGEQPDAQHHVCQLAEGMERGAEGVVEVPALHVVEDHFRIPDGVESFASWVNRLRSRRAA